MRRLLSSLLLILLCTPALLAHPVPQGNRDRIIVVRLTPDALIVDYRLEIDEGSIATDKDFPDSERTRATSRNDLFERYSRYFVDILGRNLDASLDGDEQQFMCVQRKYVATDHVRFDFRFVAPWSMKPGVEHKMKFHECNYILHPTSRVFVYLAADEAVSLVAAKAPDAEMMRRSSDERRSGDEDKLRRASATFKLATVERPGIYTPAYPPDDLSYKDDPQDNAATAKPSAAPVESEMKAAPEELLAHAKLPPAPVGSSTAPQLPVPTEAPDASGESSVVQAPSLWDRLTDPNALLHLLLDSREGLAVLLLFAAIAGAAHALTPGHGKTLVAAYLVGERGTLWHAIILGVVTTLTHTAAVIVLAVVFQLLPGSEKQILALQGLIGGLLIAGLGLWLLIRRLTGKADHFHLGSGHHHHHHDGHHHHHHHDHAHADHTHDDHGAIVASARKKTGMWEVVTLGMGGGILPCWDAVVLLGFAISSGRANLGLPLVLAFSAGLATVLVVLGMAVVGAKQVAQLAAPSSRRLHAVARALPLFSAVFITLMGLWLCYGALATK